MVRCFVGVMVPDTIKQAAEALQKKLSKFKIKCKFVEPENMHICLSFLGEINKSRLESIKTKLDTVSKQYKKFDVCVGKVRFIPNKNYIRVIVLEVLDEEGNLEKLRKFVVRAVDGDSKPPHLTLCRVKGLEDKKKLVNEFGGIICGKKFSIRRIQLIKSELRRSGPIYSILHESELS